MSDRGWLQALLIGSCEGSQPLLCFQSSLLLLLASCLKPPAGTAAPARPPLLHPRQGTVRNLQQWVQSVAVSLGYNAAGVDALPRALGGAAPEPTAMHRQTQVAQSLATVLLLLLLLLLLP